MNRSKKRKNRLFPMLITVMVLTAVLTPAAYADTDGTEPKITQQPDQLVLQLGTRWAGVEFELRTDAGIFPVPVVVDEYGVLTMDLGGSTTYTLSCIHSTAPIPDPEPEQTGPPPPAVSDPVPEAPVSHNEIYTQMEYATRRGREQATGPAELPCGVVDDSLEERDACRELMGLLDRAEATATGTTAKGIRAIRMRIDGYSSKEIGELLGAPANHVTAWVSKARNHIRMMGQPGI